MSEPYVWGALPRAVNDPTVIDEAIATAITAHNDDPDAHLDEDQALQSHRAAEIIDHAAESVVNDKIVADARAYTAIVDPTTEYDYATIESALAYVVSKGGGTILIKAGEHFIDETITVPRGVNLTGEGIGVTNVYAVADALPAINFEGGINEDTAQTILEGITFVRTLGHVFTGGNQTNSGQVGIYFRDCSFENGGKYGLVVTNDFSFESCIFATTTTAALDVVEITLRQCVFVSDVSGVAMAVDPSASDGAKATIYDSHFEAIGSAHMTGSWRNSMMINTTFVGITSVVPGANSGCLANKYFGCTFSSYQNNSLYIDGSVLSFTGNGFTADEYDETYPKIRLRSTSASCVFANNYVIHLPENTGTGNSVVNNVQRVTDLPPPPVGEDIIYTATRNVSFSFSGYTYQSGIDRTGVYVFGRTPTAPGGTMYVFRWNGTNYVSIYSATKDVSGTVVRRYNSHRDRYYIVEDWSTTNLRLTVYEYSGTTITARQGDIGSLGYRVNVRDTNAAGTQLIGVRNPVSRIITIISRATATYTIAANYTLPAIIDGGSSVTPNADDVWYSNDYSKVYVKAGGGKYLYILGLTGSTLSFIRAIKIDATITFGFVREKPDGSLVVSLSGAPYIREYTYNNGAYENIALFQGELSNDVRDIATVTTDGSIAVLWYGSSLRISLFRKNNDEYILSDNYITTSTDSIVATPIDGDSGTIVQNMTTGNQIGTLAFDI